MEKYLYLTKTEWQHSWVHGGVIPLNLASSYLSEERSGIYTPDETVIYDSQVDVLSLGPGIKIGGYFRNLTMRGNTINGVKMPDVEGVNRYREDGVILSLCNVASSEIRDRLGKACCVKILDVETLKEIIDSQLGVIGRTGSCTYTTGHQRHHFLKSTDDSWQEEYRLFWLADQNKEVTLPTGIAVPFDI